MKELQGDPGGYPCHDNAEAILRRYDHRKHGPHMNKAGGKAVQQYWNWKFVWMAQCLRLMRPWGNTPLTIEVAPRDTEDTFSGF